MAQRFELPITPIYGGIGNDDYLLGENQVYFSKNLNIYDPKNISVSKKVRAINNIGTVEPRFIILDNYNRPLVTNEVGEIYSDTTKVYTMTTGDDIAAAVTMPQDYNGDLYETLVLFTENAKNTIGLSKVKWDDVSNTVWNSGIVTENFSTITFNTEYPSEGKIVALYVPAFAGTYFARANYVHKVDVFGTITSEMLDVGDTIVDMTFFQDLIRIYTASGEVVYWDGITQNAVTFSQRLQDGIRGVMQEGPLDYVFLTSGGISVISGLERTQIASPENFIKFEDSSGSFIQDASGKSIYSKFQMSKIVEEARQHGCNMQRYNIMAGTDSIYSYGSKLSVGEDAFALLCDQDTNGNTVGGVVGIASKPSGSSSAKLVYGVEGSSDYYIGEIDIFNFFELDRYNTQNHDDYCSGGFFVTKEYDGGNAFQRKTLVKMELYGQDPGANTDSGIQIWADVDNNGFEKILNFGNSINGRFTLEGNKITKEFSTIRFYIELKQAGSSNLMPYIRYLKFIYEENENQIV